MAVNIVCTSGTSVTSGKDVRGVAAVATAVATAAATAATAMHSGSSLLQSLKSYQTHTICSSRPPERTEIDVVSLP